MSGFNAPNFEIVDLAIASDLSVDPSISYAYLVRRPMFNYMVLGVRKSAF